MKTVRASSERFDFNGWLFEGSGIAPIITTPSAMSTFEDLVVREGLEQSDMILYFD